MNRSTMKKYYYWPKSVHREGCSVKHGIVLTSNFFRSDSMCAVPLSLPLTINKTTYKHCVCSSWCHHCKQINGLIKNIHRCWRCSTQERKGEWQLLLGCSPHFTDKPPSQWTTFWVILQCQIHLKGMPLELQQTVFLF